jgi:hypothetical protein
MREKGRMKTSRLGQRPDVNREVKSQHQGMKLTEKKVSPGMKEEEENVGFAFRIKIGEYEVEIRGKHEEVTKTLENLPSLVTNVQKAFDNLKPKTIATLTVKTEPTKSESSESVAQSYPKVASAANCEEAILRILETDWGKWRPRTMEELKETMKANALTYSGRVLNEALNELADKGMVRRWNTNTGFVYILAEEKPLSSGEEAQ